MAPRVRVGVIGAGAFAQNNHIPCLLAHPSVALAWACDADPRRVERIRAMYGLAGFGPENLDRSVDQVDIVLLSLPYGLRDKYYRLCARKGLAVYVEKPFARTVSEHDEISNLFKSGFLTIGFNRRAYRNRSIVDLACSLRMFGELRGVFIRQGFFGLSGYSGFRTDARLAGGGVLIESGIHLIDTVIAITRPTSVSVSASKVMHHDGLDYYIEGCGTLNAGAAAINLKIQISSLHNFASGIWFSFDHAVVHYPIAPEEFVTIRGEHNHVIGSLDLDVPGAVTVADSLTKTWTDCIQGYCRGQSVGVSPEDTRSTTQILEQLYGGIRV